MTPILDLQTYYGKLARNEAITEDEIRDLLKMAAHFSQLSSYLAECQAATTEGLPASASKSVRGRHASICDTAAKGLRGDSSGIRYPGRRETALERCEKAAAAQHEAIRAHDAKVAEKRAGKAVSKG